jgi:two-component system, response regulator PdtaR
MGLDCQNALPTSRAPPFDIETRERTSARLRILVIEDDMLIGMLFSETLVSMGHQVCAIAVNEHEAVTAARDHVPDIMIVDAKLGQGSGIAAVDDIIADAFIPHVFVTGDKPGVLELRPQAVVVEKPFHVRDLADAIELAMTMARTN